MDRRQFLMQTDPIEIPATEDCPPGECTCEDNIMQVFSSFRVKPMYQLAILTALALLCAFLFGIIKHELAIADMLNKRLDNTIACGLVSNNHSHPWRDEDNKCPHQAITGIGCCCDPKRKTAQLADLVG